MNFNILTLFMLINYLSANFIYKDSSKNHFSTAINGVVENYFNKHNERFDIISAAENEFHFDEIVNGIMKTTNQTVRITELLPDEGPEIVINESTIFLFENDDVFISYLQIIRFSTSKRNIHILFYVPNLTTTTFNLINKKFVVPGLKQKSFLINEKGKLVLKSISRFSQPNCRTQKLKAINYFSETNLKWSSSRFFLDKIDNFQGCEIIFGGIVSFPAAYEELQKNNIIKITGYHVDLINIIAPYANYKVNISFFKKVSSGRKKNISPDVFISSLLLHGTRNREHNFNTPTQAIHYELIRIIVPPRESYTSFEKLLLAFDKPVWNLIIITFALAFMAIIILRFCPRFIREFVIGRNVKEPALNVLIAFFGVGQTILPRRNFARFLLIMFILYSLIIRTAYQGKSFEFLQKDMKRKGVQTVKDLFDKNYTIYTNKFLQTEWKTADIIKQ
ncbi:CLUMA_CG005447, isoform A [Clunio marinus]|uniref:CLUMA_CG005447, isoform A n=1 Tax=Clunio marinus TaxID=568069 RepID=A0A1J1HZ54_9DIPT|nr:CLUMA_CG005447, isoform A [Clunio marinus]